MKRKPKLDIPIEYLEAEEQIIRELSASHPRIADKERWHARFLARLEDCGGYIEPAAARMGRARRLVYLHMKDSPTLRKMVEEVREYCKELIQATIYERQWGYSPTSMGSLTRRC